MRLDRATLGLIIALAGAGLALWSVPVGVTGTFIGLMIIFSDRRRPDRAPGGETEAGAEKPSRHVEGERFRELQAKRMRRPKE